MSELAKLESWVNALEGIIDQQGAADDPAINRQLSLISIELDSLRCRLPDTNPDAARELFRIHESRIIDQVLITLQSALGYYSLPDQKKGDNEPAIGSESAYQLKQQLQESEIDMYGAYERLAKLLNKPVS